MKDIQQLIKKNSQEGRYEDIFPKTFIDAVLDKESGVTLTDILAMFNMLFLSYNGSRSRTRLQVPSSLRREGLWVTYVLYDKTVVTEWYSAEAIDDTTFGDSANWRDGSNALVGDISISSDGYWVINGEVTNIKAQGEAGIPPILRVGSNNHLQVSYTNGSTYVDVSPNPVFTQFRVSNNKLEQSVDLGLTWTVASDYIAAWFRFTGTTGSSQADNVGKIQISRDNGATWSDLSGEFTNSLHIKGYVATVGALPSTAVQGDIYGVGPTYDPSDTGHTNPIYQLYVKDGIGWVNNGRFTSISAGVVQELGGSETELISQKGTTQVINTINKNLLSNLSFYVPYVSEPELQAAINVDSGTIVKQNSVSDAILYTYSNIDTSKEYYLSSSWLSNGVSFPLVIYADSNGGLISYQYANKLNELMEIALQKLDVPDGTSKIYVNSRYKTYGECGLYNKIILGKDTLLKVPITKERAENLYSTSIVKDGLCVVKDNIGFYMSALPNYSVAIINIEEDSQYILANYDCLSKSVAVLDENFVVTTGRNSDTINSRISKTGAWEADNSPITISTIKGDRYVAFNVQRRNDGYYKNINTNIVFSKIANYSTNYIPNIESTFIRKLFDAGLGQKMDINVVYGSYYNIDGDIANNANSCRTEIQVSGGTPLLIKALSTNSRYILEKDSSGTIIKSYNVPPTYNDIREAASMVIVTSSKTTTVSISSYLNSYISGIEVFTLTPPSSFTPDKEISILFVGNSLTQDAVSYVPFLLRNLYPNIKFKIYMWYNGGKTLEEQYQYFINDSVCEIFSVAEDGISWTNSYSSVTMKTILSTYKFDIVCLQEYFNYKTSYEDSDIDVYNNIISYIQDNYNLPFKVVTLVHAPKRDNATTIYNLTIEGVKKIFKETITEDILVPGVAIYDALSTDLNSLGDMGGLSLDGTHAQEGLPCLLEAYTLVLWIYNSLSIPKSIANNTNYVTPTNYPSINVPGPNLGSGVIIGSIAENRLAQKVAIQAFKKTELLKYGS